MDHAASVLSHHPGAAARGSGEGGEENRLKKAKDKLREIFQRPSTGRTTALGRRVEKPGTTRPGGPSGQTDNVQHDRKHTNK